VCAGCEFLGPSPLLLDQSKDWSLSDFSELNACMMSPSQKKSTNIKKRMITNITARSCGTDQIHVKWGVFFLFFLSLYKAPMAMSFSNTSS